MNLINQQVTNISQTDFSYEGIMKFVEKVGRICYNSFDKTTDESWKSFTKFLLRNKHFSPFGHATIHLKTAANSEAFSILQRLTKNCKGASLRYVCSNTKDDSDIWYWSISMRLIVEFLSELEQKLIFKHIDASNNAHYAQRRSFLCTTQIAVTREINRHGWNLDIMEKSTRYTECFDIIKPYWYDTKDWLTKFIYKISCKSSFIAYKHLLRSKLKKQEARGVLPLDTASQIIYTAFDSQWEDLFKKRLISGAHPDCRQLVELIRNSF